MVGSDNKAQETVSDETVGGLERPSFAQVTRQSLLEGAVRIRDAERVKHLLTTDSKATTVGAHLRTPLHYAARLGDSENMALLLEHGADPNVADEQGYEPLHRSVQSGNAGVVRQLLAVVKEVNNLTKESKSAMGLAKKFGFAEIEKVLGE